MNGRYVTLLGLATIAILVAFSSCVNPRKGYAPSQPIAFSHQIHAGVNQIPCRYCHVGPGEGQHSTVPSVNTCMNCHSQVATTRPEIQKVQQAWKSGERIEWVKVHDLPDHVRFVHQPHINSGLDCTECHGPVETMDVIETQNAFNMGWCIECHRRPSKMDPEQSQASTDCVTCHY